MTARTLKKRTRAKQPTPHPRTPDGRYFVVRGRLWRRSNPDLPAKKRDTLVKRLMKARAELRKASGDQRLAIRARIDRAKRALGERGKPWWSNDAPDYNRHLIKNSPYATWYAQLKQ